MASFCTNRILFVTAMVSAIVVLVLPWVPSASASSSAAYRKPSLASLLASGSPVDPFVSSAPLIVATECSDGIALLALHTSFAEQPLLLDTDEMPSLDGMADVTHHDDDDDDDANHHNKTSLEDTNAAAQNTTNTTRTTTTTTTPATVDLQDIPRSYRGPFRIHLIDGVGTTMVCAGWRSHTQMMVDYCRDLAKEELQIYGPPPMSLTHCQEYGNYLAQQTSLWLAYTGVMKRHRWSCVGLLATCRGDHEVVEGERDLGCLWLVDKMGAFRVRGHAVGGGPLAGLVNQYLAMERSRNDKTRTAERALSDLLDFLSEQPTLIPRSTRVELAILTPSRNAQTKLKRVFASGLRIPLRT